MTVNYDDWEIIPMAIGVAFLTVLMWILYAGLLYVVSYLIVAGLAYYFKFTIPTEFLHILIIMSLLQSAWKIYKLVNNR